jgi:hypothetical protein
MFFEMSEQRKLHHPNQMSLLHAGHKAAEEIRSCTNLSLTAFTLLSTEALHKLDKDRYPWHLAVLAFHRRFD